MRRQTRIILAIAAVAINGCGPQQRAGEKTSISGIYPHLAVYNQGNECGIGAVVPWNESLWLITYSPHQPQGSSDKLYEITPGLQQIIRPESIGGTPANRMIHAETNQLFVGPYVINQEGHVRTIPYTVAPGRHTAVARHLTNPEHQVILATMEEGFYEVDMDDLQVSTFYRDGHEDGRVVNATSPSQGEGSYAALYGAHGKGAYSGQGVLVYSNNGEASQEALRQFDIESGSLSEWDGQRWKLIRRNQFVEVTGPGGIYGNGDLENDPIWTTGWDHKSLIVGVRKEGTWAFFRLPKASHSYDGAHGWNTEWPRIRDIGTSEEPDYLMTMHGMFWRFPSAFASDQSAGIRPRSSYLKVIGDFARWNDQIVFGCDDSAQKEFLNTRKHKGGIGGPGQSNSNVWFVDPSLLDQLGPTTAHGAVWLKEDVMIGEWSEPFLFAGWSGRSAWIVNHGLSDMTLTVEVDLHGDGQWIVLDTIMLAAGQSQMLPFEPEQSGEWIRMQAHQNGRMTVSFNYRQEETGTVDREIFNAISPIHADHTTGGLLYGLGNDRRTLGVEVQLLGQESAKSIGYYELTESLDLVPKIDTATQNFIVSKFAIPKDVVQLDSASVLIVDDLGRRWRLPYGDDEFMTPTQSGQMRLCREVATERDLFNCHGTFYELPAENADGFAKIRPIASHDFWIHDYASYRGLLVMSGIEMDASPSKHVIKSDDGNAAVWVGVIDDLWKLGKPRGRGGPWNHSTVQNGVPSDAYLIGFYDNRALKLQHDLDSPVSIRLEVDATGHGPWIPYETITVLEGQSLTYDFPSSFEARWIRFVADHDCSATAILEYY